MATTTRSNPSGAVTGMPRLLLRAEGVAALVAGVAIYLVTDGVPIWLIPLLFASDVSMVGYLRGPALGAILYNAAHTWATGLAVLGAGLWLDIPGLTLAGAILIAHVGMDRAAGYGLKYPTAFGDTHLGWIGKGDGGARRADRSDPLTDR